MMIPATPSNPSSNPAWNPIRSLWWKTQKEPHPSGWCWLVLDVLEPPLWKIWLRQLGWSETQYISIYIYAYIYIYGKNRQCSKPPTSYVRAYQTSYTIINELHPPSNHHPAIQSHSILEMNLRFPIDVSIFITMKNCNHQKSPLHPAMQIIRIPLVVPRDRASWLPVGFGRRPASSVAPPASNGWVYVMENVRYSGRTLVELCFFFWELS